MKEKAGLTYSDAGVDIESGNKAVELMRQIVRTTWRPEVIGDLGGFSGLFSIDKDKYKQPVLVSGTDGVGTKLKVAMLMQKHDTIGIDLVAMCVNDIATSGAEPLFFLDYLATGRLVPEKAAAIVAGIADGCRQAGCALIGGETAEMPDFYGQDEYDLAGFAVGVVEKERIIDGSRIQPGDCLIGLSSSGLHSNGYSLARRVLLEAAGYRIDDFIPEFGRSLGEEMLEPTRIYVNLLKKLNNNFDLLGIAHITGGGLTENIPRLLPPGTAVVIDPTVWPVSPVFSLIRQIGQVEGKEMFRTFNMGLGLVLFLPSKQAGACLDFLKKTDETAYLVGQVVKGEKGIEFTSLNS
ncbi:MAG: Phosphoribosylformylglycinamidine cyclo-ligase [Desulfotomaculum sp. 46_296]|nr:MAG: Phosphoribosylformylglycinamidine cyclo-ligase [Desulfotomaculum sp. 46_296]HAU32471.1 phosphoribosylformylglycinamidine cyclo-ligase [Desulfotomaculum sp.]